MSNRYGINTKRIAERMRNAARVVRFDADFEAYARDVADALDKEIDAAVLARSDKMSVIEKVWYNDFIIDSVAPIDQRCARADQALAEFKKRFITEEVK